MTARKEATRIPRREDWIDLPDEYGEAGMQVRLWLNYPVHLKQDLFGGDDQKTKAALRQIVLEHNGWTDFGGNPYPPCDQAEVPAADDQPAVPGFWEAIPDELAAAILVLVRIEAGKLAVSLVSRPRR